MNSLRNKIIFIYGNLILVLLLLAILVYTDLKYLQSQIVETENIRLLQSSTLQIQNKEENLLLQKTTDANFQLFEQVENTRNLLNRSRPTFEELADSDKLDALDNKLQRYSEVLDELVETNYDNKQRLRDELRVTSDAINNTVLQFGQQHHLLLTKVTDGVSLTLVLALTVITLISIASAFFVIRHLIRPIRALEHQLDAVADGDMSKLTLVSKDAELQSFVQHFNTMLDRLRSHQSQLRHHEKAAALGVLVSGVAHELNNPLSNISTSVQLLLEDDDTRPETRQQWLTHVDSETERARRIVRRLLDSVRQTSHEVQSMTAAELVRSATTLIHRQLDPSIFIDIEDVSESTINVNRERFQQVFINLIRNAVDASAKNIWVFGDTTTWDDSRPDNIELVEGEVEIVSEARELMLFTIADDGPGIPDENLSQLFTPFFTTKVGGEGTGLGLYLVHEIVEEHDGCITVENREAGGTQFLIWIPITEEAST